MHKIDKTVARNTLRREMVFLRCTVRTREYVSCTRSILSREADACIAIRNKVSYILLNTLPLALLLSLPLPTFLPLSTLPSLSC